MSSHVFEGRLGDTSDSGVITGLLATLSVGEVVYGADSITGKLVSLEKTGASTGTLTRYGAGPFVYEASGAPAPTTPAPTTGSRWFNTDWDQWMFYDSTRAKWLSEPLQLFQWSDKGNVPTGNFFRYGDSIQFDPTDGKGFLAVRDACIVGLSFTRDSTNSNVSTIEIVTDTATLATTLGTGASLTGKTMTIDEDVAEDAVLAVRNQAGGATLNDMTGHLFVRWRVDA